MTVYPFFEGAFPRGLKPVPFRLTRRPRLSLASGPLLLSVICHLFYCFTLTFGSTDRPGRSSWLGSSSFSLVKSMRTGTRWTTFT